MEGFEKSTSYLFWLKQFKWILEPEPPNEVPKEDIVQKSPKAAKMEKATHNLRIMKQMLKCTKENLANDGNMPKEYAIPLLEGMRQAVCETSEAVTTKSQAKENKTQMTKRRSLNCYMTKMFLTWT